MPGIEQGTQAEIPRGLLTEREVRGELETLPAQELAKLAHEIILGVGNGEIERDGFDELDLIVSILAEKAATSEPRTWPEIDITQSRIVFQGKALRADSVTPQNQ